MIEPSLLVRTEQSVAEILTFSATFEQIAILFLELVTRDCAGMLFHHPNLGPELANVKGQTKMAAPREKAQRNFFGSPRHPLTLAISGPKLEGMMVTFPEGTTPLQELHSHLNGYCGEHEDLNVCMRRVRELVEELLPLPGTATKCIGPEPHLPECSK